MGLVSGIRVELLVPNDYLPCVADRTMSRLEAVSWVS